MSGGVDSTAVVAPPSLTGDDVDYSESVENVIKSTFRPANILMTNVQICLMFWIFGSLARILIRSLLVASSCEYCQTICVQRGKNDQSIILAIAEFKFLRVRG